MAVSVDDVVAWGKLPDPGTGTPEETLLGKVLDAVVAHVTANYVVDADPAEWTDDQDIAVMMATVRLWKRRDTPEGLLEFDELGAVRVSSVDGDVEKLLSPIQRWGFA